MKTHPSSFVSLTATCAVLALNLLLIQPVRADVFSNTGSMGTARYLHTATLLPNGQVLVAGGRNSSGYLSSAELYDPATGTWSVTGSMAVTRYEHTATLLPDGKVLVVGGANGSISAPSTAELYDPAAGTWAYTGSMIDARVGGHTATLLPNGKVLIMGGVGFNGILSSAELYDPANGTWAPAGSMNVARCFFTATLLPNGKVLVVGGIDSNYNYLSSAELYDPIAGTWMYTGSMYDARYQHTATLLANGKVLIAAGGNTFGLTDTEVYDPSAGTWAETGSLNTARRGASAGILLPNGKVLLAGGNNSSGYVSSAELYDPSTGMWTTTGSLNAARIWYVATLLSNGQVLVAGGQSSSGYLSSAELYTYYLPLSSLTPANGIISTVAGNYGESKSEITSTSTFGDGGLATNYYDGVSGNPLYVPYGVALDAYGNLFIADSEHYRIRKVDPNGYISTIVVNSGFASDGTLLDAGSVNYVAADAFGNNVYFSTDASYLTGGTSSGYPNILKVDAISHNVSIVATFNDGPPSVPYGVAVDTSGNVYGAVGTTIEPYGGDASVWKFPYSDYANQTLVADRVPYNPNVYPPTGPGYIHEGVAVDANGNVYIADGAENRILKVDTSENVTTIAGNGSQGYSGDNNPATQASLNQPRGVAVDAYGDIFIADTGNKVIRMVNAVTGIITTVAGGGSYVGGIGYYPFYNGPAINVSLGNPVGVAVDPASLSLFIADAGGAIRKVSVAPGN